MLRKLCRFQHQSLSRRGSAIISGGFNPLRYVSTLAPLKIAYFGSDTFSVRTLQKLLQYQKENPDRISNIDIITRTVKPRGRKSKTYTDLPIGNFHGTMSNSKIIRVDSKEAIRDIAGYDMAVAVSFGILIPNEFLKSCKYGGLNVHPSLLPRYSGSSPIQYALMNQDTVTGVSVQTLHPTKFDRGDIVLQSEEIQITHSDDYNSLVEKLGDLGGLLLIDVIDRDLFLPNKRPKGSYEFSLAPKIKSSRSQIDWTQQKTKEIVALNKALGSLFTTKYVDIFKKNKEIQEFQRVNLDGISEIDIPQGLHNPGEFGLYKDLLIVKTVDGAVAIEKLKMQCCSEETSLKFMNTLGVRCGNTEYIFI